MRLRLLTVLCSPLGSFPAGAVVDLPEDLAVELLSEGNVEQLPEEEPQTAEEDEPWHWGKK